MNRITREDIELWVDSEDTFFPEPPNPPSNVVDGKWVITRTDPLGGGQVLVHWQWIESPDEQERQWLLKKATNDLVDIVARILPTSTSGCLYTFQVAERVASELKALTDGQQINLRDLLSGRDELVESLRTALGQEEARSAKAEAELARVTKERDEAQGEWERLRSADGPLGVPVVRGVPGHSWVRESEGKWVLLTESGVWVGKVIRVDSETCWGCYVHGLFIGSYATLNEATDAVRAKVLSEANGGSKDEWLGVPVHPVPGHRWAMTEPNTWVLLDQNDVVRGRVELIDVWWDCCVYENGKGTIRWCGGYKTLHDATEAVGAIVQRILSKVSK